MYTSLTDLIESKGILLADGATGTNLFAMGLETGDSPELWNVDHPERIEKLYRDFVEAGSDLILTNSFGGTHYRLALHKAGDRVQELNEAAARIARRIVEESGRQVIVAGSIGPTGEILEPNGPVSIEQAAAAFREQAAALKDGGVDVLWIETISSREEIQAAMQGTADLGLPLVFTVSIDTNGRTMMGLTANDVIGINAELDPQALAVGTNCGIGAAEVVAAICNLSTALEEQTTATGSKPLLVAKANCGIPEYVDGKIVYNGTPQIMADYTKLAADAGASVIGGCCGTTPAHIKAMRDVLDNYTPSESPDLDTIVNTLGEVSKGAQAQLGGDLSLAAGSSSGRGARTSRRRKNKSAS